MSTPTPQPAPVPANGQVNVPIQAIVKALHEQYQKIVQQLVGENAELLAGVEAQGQELAYLRSVVAQHQAEAEAAKPGPSIPGALPADLLG